MTSGLPAHVNPELQPILYTADLLYTGLGGGQRGGGVVVMRGLIAAAGDVATLRERYPHAAEVPAGSVIAPPPANAHTHLDMSAYDFRALPYFRWIPEVVLAQRERRGLAGAGAGAAALAGWGQSVGDIVWSAEAMRALLVRTDLQGTLYWEVLGPDPTRADEIFAGFRAQVEGFRRLERGGGPRVGISPHATYTLSARLMRLVTEYAAGEGLPVQIHVAEHPSEVELFATGTGPLWEHRIPGIYPANFAEVIGRVPEPGLTPVRYLDELGVLARKPTLVHMVNVSGDDIARVAAHGCAVVSCPRSNANLQCGRLPIGDLVAAGVEVALGTDSVASGETLDARDEYAFACTLYPELDPRILLRAAVKGGARALGLRPPQIRRGEAWGDKYAWDWR